VLTQHLNGKYCVCVSYLPPDERHTTGWTCYDTDHLSLMFNGSETPIYCLLEVLVKYSLYLHVHLSLPSSVSCVQISRADFGVCTFLVQQAILNFSVT
jgi:hypothetical protein